MADIVAKLLLLGVNVASKVAFINILVTVIIFIIWASTRQNLSSVFLTKRDSNQSPQLQKLARKLKFCLWQVKI